MGLREGDWGEVKYMHGLTVKMKVLAKFLAWTFFLSTFIHTFHGSVNL